MKFRVGRRICSLVICLGCLLALVGKSASHAAGGHEQPACSVEQLSALETMDLKNMNTLTREGPYPQTTEGATIKHFYRSDTLKAMDATFYGEIGKLNTNYYFLSPKSYLISIADYEYTNFIYEPDWKVKSETHYRYFFCDGVLIESSGDPNNAAYFQRFDGLLAELLAAVPKENP